MKTFRRCIVVCQLLSTTPPYPLFFDFLFFLYFLISLEEFVLLIGLNSNRVLYALSKKGYDMTPKAVVSSKG